MQDDLSSTHDIAVVGAGIIGVTCALALARQGLRVTLFDQRPPGQGASAGNAGHLATEQVLPIAEPALLRHLPAMLLDPLGPLRLDWRYLPRALPWFVRLLANLRRAPFERSIAGLQALNAGSLAAWQRLLASLGQTHLLRTDGSLLVCERPESRPHLQAHAQRLQALGVTVNTWSAATIQAVAPALHPRLAGGLFFPATGHVLDPYVLVQTLANAARERGVRFVQQRVEDGRVAGDRVILRTATGVWTTGRVLLACGAHSAPLTERLTGQRVPLDTERGYHLHLPQVRDRLPFAVTSLERRFIMTPLASGLRLAGTVEFAGLERPANYARAWHLLRLSEGLFADPLDTQDASPWMGLRPSLPDSLPVIDRVAGGRVLLAFGHHHLGLTQAALTAELIATLALDGALDPAPLPDLMPYRLDRFQQRRRHHRAKVTV